MELTARVGDLLEQFFDEVDVGHDHSTAAVSLAAQLVHRVAAGAVSKQSTVDGRTPSPHTRR